MKKIRHLSAFLIVFLLSPGFIWGQAETTIYSTGFEAAEGFTAGTTYNNTTIKLDGPSGQQWGTYYGTAATTGAISGAMSMQMRWYTSAPSNLGYTFTNFDLTNVTRVTFKAANTNGINVIASYSTDGGSTYTGDQTYTLSTTSSEYEYIISSTGEFPSVRIKFQLTYTTAPTATSRLYVDDVTVYGITGGNPTVATPQFTPPAGNYFSAQDVTISTSTENATIYYTTDGSNPDNTSTEYTEPINVSSTTILKAIAYADGFDPSPIATALYSFPLEVADIATLRTGLTDGTIYRLTGEAVLTYQSTERNVKYIQDATGAILIDDPAGIITTTYNLYDGITGITGTLGTFNGMLQFTPVTDPGAASSSGNTVTPEDVTLTELTTGYQARLVRVLNTTITGSSPFAANTSYALADASGSGVLRTQYDDLDYIGTAVPTLPQNLTGVVLEFNTNMQLVPRGLADFEAIIPEDPTIFVNPATLSGFSYVQGNGPSAEQTFVVSGENLTAGIIITASADYEISLTSGTGYTSPLSLTPIAGSVGETTIYVRLKAGLTAGDYNDEIISLTSTGASGQSVTCSGTVSPPPPPDAPVALAATDITTTGFTANWQAVSGATSYRLDVYTSTVTPATGLFFSEYIEGSSNNKALEIFNGTGSAADLSDYTVYTYSNGAVDPSYTLELSGTLDNGDVYIIANASANAAILALADVTSNVTFYNGDDAVVLYKESTASNVDIIGRIGEDPGAAWGTAPLITVNQTLVRKSSVISGVTVNPASGFPTLETEWDAYDIDVITYLGSHSLAGDIIYVTGFQDLNVGDVTSYPVTGLAPGTTYYYVVRAVNDNGTSENSNVIEVTTGGIILTPPVIISPTATNITVNSAILGGNITSDGGSPVTERGTVWNTTGSVTIDDNKLAEGGTATGIFTHLRSGLPEGTQIFYCAYATNAEGTTLTNEASFYTLFSEPDNHVTNFTAGTATVTSIPLTWTDATGTVLPEAYLIKGSSVSFDDIADPADGVPESNAALIRNVAQGTQAYTFENLTPETPYFFKIYPYTNSGTAIDYKTDPVVPTATATTLEIPAGALVYEPFDYPEGEALQAQLNWNAVNSGDDILISSGNLTYNGLQASAGNKVSFAGAGMDAFRTFVNQTSNIVYYSFIMNVTDLNQLNATGGYFTGLASSSSSFGATVWTGLDGEGYLIGVNPRTTAANTVWVAGTQTIGNAVLVVVSYEFVEGTGNDVVNIWVNPAAASLGAAIPPAATATATNTDGTDLGSISQFFIRQDSDSETPFIDMDECRVGTSWADVTPTGAASGTLNLTVFLQGLYNSNGQMNQAYDENGPKFGNGIADQITVTLNDPDNYSTVVYEDASVMLNTDGIASLSVPANLNGDYYITIKHRNSISTVSAMPVSFASGIINYAFDAQEKAFGNNLLETADGYFVIFGGDVDQNGAVDTGDMTPVDNDSSAFSTGYLNTDCDGNGSVDTGDMTIVDNNSAAFISVITP
ncbi:MAG: chitobiase/beta-hexosaminidase C-terminal domain-containing protein [Lentimicrobium sp.]|uniref:chitobiase/beta-hexosaminidase C-terminal domain-containing protein n=1 Tax=Lentimicrobium sp. TaxID=2034841 RepID=UPI0025E35B9A|nr:chitobiase/beta-hexosaminidase C-terminal domain-containing protein [Lentimicrobium sp.]MCO5258191.1 chitobiase/beta-hexosaminidase C-terminal domain-containing protein [Lentimicrobium sp.]